MLVGHWQCACDIDEIVKLRRPPDSTILAQLRKFFEAGESEAILAVGSPSHQYLWTHLHGIHRRYADTGEIQYVTGSFVRDKEGFYYMASPFLDTVVDNDLDMAERHLYCYGQFVLPRGQEADWLDEAVENNIELEVEVVGVRDRNYIDWEMTSLKDILTDELTEVLNAYVAGKVDVIDLLRKINTGKTPLF